LARDAADEPLDTALPMLCRRLATSKTALRPLRLASLAPVPSSLVSFRPLSSTPTRRALWGWLPDPSNEPLAGTGMGAAGPPWLFMLEVRCRRRFSRLLELTSLLAPNVAGFDRSSDCIVGVQSELDLERAVTQASGVAGRRSAR
jgi:hypothetical protein